MRSSLGTCVSLMVNSVFFLHWEISVDYRFTNGLKSQSVTQEGPGRISAHSSTLKSQVRFLHLPPASWSMTAFHWNGSRLVPGNRLHTLSWRQCESAINKHCEEVMGLDYPLQLPRRFISVFYLKCDHMENNPIILGLFSYIYGTLDNHNFHQK